MALLDGDAAKNHHCECGRWGMGFSATINQDSLGSYGSTRSRLAAAGDRSKRIRYFFMKSKLKLLRIVKVLCANGADWKMACMHTALAKIDEVVRKILTDRITLRGLVSAVAECQEGYVGRLKHWRGGWRLLMML